MHRVDEERHMLGLDVRRDAVTEVEHVAGMRAEIIEHGLHFVLDRLG